MKPLVLAAPAVLALVAAGCSRAPREPAPAPVVAAVPATSPGAPLGSFVRGRVVEAMSTAGYTYVRVQPEGASELWAASTEFPVSPGDEVVVSTAMPMHGYESKTLHRTFDVVYFADSIEVVGAPAGAAPRDGAKPSGLASSLRTAIPSDVAPDPAAAPHGSPASTVPAGVVLEGIERAPGGVTVAELLARKDELAGRDVSVRGRIVKLTPGVLGKNWLHLRDGSGEGGAADVTVTTEAAAAVGDLVVVRGRVATDRDLGSGYAYAVLIEDATLEGPEHGL